jgi:carboxymethylenebutenolidase
MSGAWQGRAASYYASGLVLFAVQSAAFLPRSRVICLQQPGLLKPNPDKAGGNMTAQPILTSDIIGLTRTAPLSRRGFMTASAATAAGYTLAAGPVRADVVTTDISGLTAGDAKVKVSDGEMPAYFARPTGVNNPPVVLVAMEIFGLHEYIKDVTRRLAKLGALAVAPDYYFRKGVDLTKIAEIPQLLPIVNSKPDAELLSDLDSTVAWAKSQGGDTGWLGIIGFCRGGRTVWEYAAHSGALKAGVAFYGPPVDPPNPLWPKSPTQLAPDMKAPVLGLYGEADTGIPVATVEALKAALAENKKTAEFKIYPGAPHGFHADYRSSYRKDAADDAWNQMQAWFKKYGVLG